MLFSDFNLPVSLQKSLASMGIQTPTSIQRKSFPVILSGTDMVGIAQTGTGKTIAYLLPILQQWKFSKEKNPTLVIVVPTRELVLQVVEVAKQLTAFMSFRVVGVYGGVNIAQQTPALNEGIDMIVGTPGRMLDFLLNGTLKFRSVKKWVIDEVDEMLSLGFRPQLIRLMDFLPTKRQNLMFSATLTSDVREFIHEYFIQPQIVEADLAGTALENIRQVAFPVPNFNTKIELVSFLLKEHPEFSKVLLFVSSRQWADEVYQRLQEHFAQKVAVIHSNKSQNFRFESLRKFQMGEVQVLIATDLVARGLEIEDVTHVVNFDLPDEAEVFVHRIGRTGRIHKKGVAITFLTEHDTEKFDRIESLLKQNIQRMRLPAAVEVSEELNSWELPEIKMKNQLVKVTKPAMGGGAFHEKLDKNKKVNVKIRYADKMKEKYGKPKTRGQKK